MNTEELVKRRSKHRRRFACWWIDIDHEVEEVSALSPEDAAVAYMMRKMRLMKSPLDVTFGRQIVATHSLEGFGPDGVTPHEHTWWVWLTFIDRVEVDDPLYCTACSSTDIESSGVQR